MNMHKLPEPARVAEVVALPGVVVGAVEDQTDDDATVAVVAVDQIDAVIEQADEATDGAQEDAEALGLGDFDEVVDVEGAVEPLVDPSTDVSDEQLDSIAEEADKAPVYSGAWELGRLGSAAEIEEFNEEIFDRMLEQFFVDCDSDYYMRTLTGKLSRMRQILRYGEGLGIGVYDLNKLIGG